MPHFPTTSSLYHFASVYRLVAISGFLCLLCILAITGLQPYVPIEYLMRDPAATLEQPFYLGALSNIGILFWAAGAAICLFSAALLKIWQIRSDASRFLIAFGSLSAVLGIDDLFLLHELAFPTILRIPQSAVFLCYAIVLFICLFRFRKILMGHQPLIFTLSLLLFAVSILIDLTPLNAIASSMPLATGTVYRILHLLEDGAKLLAIFVWLTYFVWAAIALVTEAITQTIERAADTSTIRQQS